MAKSVEPFLKNLAKQHSKILSANMTSLLIVVIAATLYCIAYRVYGGWLRSLFELSADRPVPSKVLQDNRDFCPAPRAIVFGHHFTSIAGTGPIVGPALAVMWGWLPATLWVVFGAIFIGAVHDFGSLVISLRNRGMSIGDIAGSVINKRVQLLFLLTLFLALMVVLAVFGIVIAGVFRLYPQSIFPSLCQIPLAIVIGILVRRRTNSIAIPSLLVLAVMYLTVFWGDVGVLGSINRFLAELSLFSWVIILLVYSYVASVLPVWVLLQPRDYINSLQLISAIGLVLIGLAASTFLGGESAAGATIPLELVAPAYVAAPPGAPPIFPFLFITIACGAISGFHCLVASGTTSKQLESEDDALFVGYGSMLFESFFAVLVILCCCAGLSLGVSDSATGELLVGKAAWSSRYASWSAAQGLPAMVGAFVDGAGNFLKTLGFSSTSAVALMGVLVASFAGTTLDTACRLQRYIVTELASRTSSREGEKKSPVSKLLSALQTTHGATLCAVGTALLVAAMPGTGKEWSWANAGTGGLVLWPMFGATNQLLGGLAFLVITCWLLRQGKPSLFSFLPMVFMLVVPAWALVKQLQEWSNSSTVNVSLIALSCIILVLEFVMIVEVWRLLPYLRSSRSS